jgi:hypothetical protein
MGKPELFGEYKGLTGRNRSDAEDHIVANFFLQPVVRPTATTDDFSAHLSRMGLESGSDPP